MRCLGIVTFLVLSTLMPMVSIAEEEPKFDSTFFDLNANGLDDRIEPLINIQEEIDIILMFTERPTQLHHAEINNIEIEVTHVYKYINAIRLDDVPSNKIFELTKISNLKIIEWQAPVHTFLDTAASAIKVRESSEYSPVVWDNNIYGEGINVAVLDTGVDNEHETFDVFEDQGVRRFIAGMNCDGGCPTDDDGNYQFTTEEDSSEDPDDFDGHGTHVASTVLGMGGDTGEDGDGDDNGDGIQDYLGIAPAARLIDMKVMADWGSGSSADINEAIEACIENVNTDWENDGEKNNGIHVMSMSLGTTSGSDGSDSQSQLVNQANAAGIVVVIAMGNDGEEEVPSPASADWSVAVGAMDNMNNINRNDDDLASYSNYGPRDDDGDSDRWDELKPSIVAPGSDITAAQGHSNFFGESSASGWTAKSGTSMATPIVSGLVALLLEADISLRPTSNSNPARDRLQEYSEAWDGEHDGSASEPDENEKYNYYYGNGYIDGYEIVDINQPDAVITEISTAPEEPVEGDTVTISIKVENEGNMDIDSSAIKLFVDQNEIEDDNSLGTINVGSNTIWTYDWTPNEGEYELQAEVYDVNPSEGNTDNNLFDTTVSVSEAPADGVDLAIIEVWTDDSDPTHNEYINIYAKIKNQGTEEAIDFELRWYDDDVRFTTLNGVSIDVEEEVTISGEWVAKEGENNLIARLVSIEPEDQNNNNDERMFSINVGPPPEEPDFTPANINIEGTLEEGQELTISFEINNLGKTNGNIDYKLMIDSVTIDNGNLDVDAEGTEIVSYDWEAEKGTHNIKIKLENSDPLETTESNNEVDTDIEIQEPRANFELNSLSWNNPLTVGETTTIIVTINNNGGKSGIATITTYAKDSLIAQTDIEVSAGQEEMVSFEWTPYEAGSIQLKAQIDNVEEFITKYAYVQEPEEENIQPIAIGVIYVNDLLSSNSLLTEVKQEDKITFSAEESYDSDGTITKYEWTILHISDNSEIIRTQENFDYTFDKHGTYSISLTVTDNSQDSHTWQGSIVVEKIVVNSNNNKDDESNIMLIGGTLAAIGIIGAIIGMKYFRTEEEEDFFDFEEMGPTNLSCPTCSGLITINTNQRPIQVACPMCQSQFVIRE
ncbi:MAG: S8 family serine peptidase [Candidatus Poseidoniia archaeon]|nr:S8 family serine peptidase [Candidatus Poseidoniia archaeon]